ncbi:hypothetical protein TNIN_161891 [Trichonephila inaurata madagascariensis]|uniref:Endonuclease/exonuclease/phosphatase domain-containing protein n=1 Tax=Trichonephila inaurata madagascariensis TaxID=2747483 RepID=A0A8X6I6D1_9ARAC|nr:hypothetical protein TNIN_161891 [Trichonephila inaurata madagascariensis]
MRDFIDKRPDIFLIQEPTSETRAFRVPNCYKNDGNTQPPGRWNSDPIKNCISHYHVSTPPLLTGVEATLIMLTLVDHEPILIRSIYIPSINEYFRNLGATLDTIFNLNNMTILVGDFNAKHTSWGCPFSDTIGNRLC